MTRKKYLVIFMAIVMLFASVPTVAFGTTAELREQLNEIRRQRDEARAQARETGNMLSGVRAEIADLLEILREYSERIMEANADLEDAELALYQTELLLAQAELDLEEAIANRDAQDKLFRSRLRAMHEQGPVGHLEVLLESTSIIDFLVRLDHVRSIAQFDQRVLEDMQAAEERVAAIVYDLNILREYQVRLRHEKNQAIIALREAEEAQIARLEAMEEDEEQAALLYELERETQRALEELFGNVEVQLRAAEAEDARRAREEAARRAAEEQARRLAALNNFDGQFQWPVPTRSHVSSPFGDRPRVFGSGREHHTGIDIPAPAGTRIVAAADGYVRTSGWMGGFGQTVIIDHGNGYSTLYAHNSRNRVTVGQRVNRGDHIADVGTTGQSTGNHLHFEIRRNGTPIDPMPFFR